MADRLNEFNPLRDRRHKPRLRDAQILAWADAHRAATGRWPTPTTGTIPNSAGTTWCAINVALAQGLRGLPGGSTLARLLHEYRGTELRYSEESLRDLREKTRQVRDQRRAIDGRATLSVERILAWADGHHAVTGRWPTARDGPITGVPGETWSTINRALRQARRGLPGPISLTRFLVQHRGRQVWNEPPKLTIEQILSWADAHRAAHGCWPCATSGRVDAAPSETWRKIDVALCQGGRGLPGGSGVARLLAERRGARNPTSLPDLSLDQILAWADAHHAATGAWPTSDSGAVPGAPGERWGTISEALRRGHRGLPGGTTLFQLLCERRPERARALTPEQIRAWAEAHRAATGRWPTVNSGDVSRAPGESWVNLNRALRLGLRGLPGGLSLAHLLGRRLAKVPYARQPRLTLDQILAWGDAHHAATGRWPGRTAGPVSGAPGETWEIIEYCLKKGHRGLPGRLSLKALFAGRRPPAVRDEVPT
jgi:hypothetical protein